MDTKMQRAEDRRWSRIAPSAPESSAPGWGSLLRRRPWLLVSAKEDMPGSGHSEDWELLPFDVMSSLSLTVLWPQLPKKFSFHVGQVRVWVHTLIVLSWLSMATWSEPTSAWHIQSPGQRTKINNDLGRILTNLCRYSRPERWEERSSKSLKLVSHGNRALSTQGIQGEPLGEK